MSQTVSMEVILIYFLVGILFYYAEASTQCYSNEFECANGECARQWNVCDGENDCGDNSDEKVCDPYNCHPLAFQCSNGKCISRRWICSGGDQCGDNSDEQHCNSHECHPLSFQCLNGECLSRVFFCAYGDECDDNSDERYCNIKSSVSCPLDWTRCPSGRRCIPSHYICDGWTDCIEISEETNCGNSTTRASTTVRSPTRIQVTSPTRTTVTSPTRTTVTSPVIAAVTSPIGIAVKSQNYTLAKEGLKSWFLRKKNPGSRTDQWGSQVHRIAVALYLADNSTFGPGNSTGEEIRCELTMQLLHRLRKGKRIGSQELALYIHALLVACVDPRDFYGDDLVQELRKRVEAAGNYTNPFLILVLCNAGDAMTARDAERVTAAYYSQHRTFWTDSQALSSMALSCISSRSSVSVDEHTLRDMLQALKKGQFRNGTVDNFRTTALVTQALFIDDSYKKDFDLDSAMKVLVDGLKGSKSLLDAYYALPVLNGKSYLNVTSSHCSKQSVAEEEALQKVLHVTGETITVHYSVWMGDEINVGRTWRLRMLVNSTIYTAIETVAKIDNRQKVEYNVVDLKPYVTALNGKEDDPEMGMFWFVYLKTLGSAKDPKIVKESPVDIKLQPNQEIILWYKRGTWSGESPMQKPVTSP